MLNTVRNRYQILEKIGQGAVGQVFEAFDRDEDRFVALKILDGHPREEVAKRFLREAEVAAQLLTHPNVIEVFEFGEDKGRLFIAMELLDGVDLRTLLRAKPSITLMDKLGLMLQICDGVGFAHSKKIVHRDLTPSNIRVLPNGDVKIMDFGLVRLASSDITTTGSIMGTPSYMSPEQAEGKTVSPASDVFSLGAVFYELLAYQKVFVADSILAILFQVLNEDHEPLAVVSPGLPPLLVEVIDKSLSKKPQARFQDATELQLALTRICKTQNEEATPSTNLLIVLDKHAGKNRTERGQALEKTFSTHSQDSLGDGPVRFTSLAGDLKTTSLAVLLRHCSDNAKTGALHLRRGPIEKRLFFVGGRLFSTATNSPRETLGQFLIRSGYISEEQLHEALMEQERKPQPLGKVIVEREWVDDELLKDLLRLKSEESIYDCFLWPDGEFAFEDGRIPEEIYLTVTLDVARLIRESDGRKRKWKQIRKLFPSALTTFATTKAVADQSQVFSAEERRFIELVEQGKNVAEIALEVHAVEFFVASRLLDLYRRGLIEVAEAPEEPSYEERVQELRDLLREGLTHFKAGENDNALEAFEAALAIDPQSKAYLYIQKIRERQGEAAAESPLSIDQVPFLAISLKELQKTTLTSEEAFVLSRVNGEWDIGSILQICPMSEQEATAIFRKLTEDGLLKLTERVAS